MATNQAFDQRADRESHTPALSDLQQRQHQLRDDLRAGFADRRGILLWQQRVGTYTLGRVPDDWHESILTDRWRSAALLANQAARDDMSEHAPDDATAMQVRDTIRQEDLLPSFRSALAFMRSAAVDWNEEPVDHTKQKFTALRPRVDQLASGQRKALEWALDIQDGRERTDHPGPIESRADILDWCDQLMYATAGYLPRELVDQVSSPASPWWRALLGGGGVLLELLLAGDVLPAMNAAIRDAAESGEESPQRDTPSTTGGSIS